MVKYLFLMNDSNDDLFENNGNDVYYDDTNKVIIVNSPQSILNIKKQIGFVDQLLDDISTDVDIIKIPLLTLKYDCLKKIIQYVFINNKDIVDYLDIDDNENLSDLYERDIPDTLKDYLIEFEPVSIDQKSYTTETLDEDYIKYNYLKKLLDYSYYYLQYNDINDALQYAIANFMYKINKDVLKIFFKRNLDNTEDMINEFIDDLTYI